MPENDVFGEDWKLRWHQMDTDKDAWERRFNLLRDQEGMTWRYFCKAPGCNTSGNCLTPFKCHFVAKHCRKWGVNNGCALQFALGRRKIARCTNCGMQLHAGQQYDEHMPVTDLLGDKKVVQVYQPF